MLWPTRVWLTLTPRLEADGIIFPPATVFRRFGESMAEAQRAQELDPLSPEIVSQVGNVYLFTRRYDESIVQYHKALDLNPNLPVVRALLSWSYAMKGMYPQALAEYDKIADTDK